MEIPTLALQHHESLSTLEPFPLLKLLHPPQKISVNPEAPETNRVWFPKTALNRSKPLLGGGARGIDRGQEVLQGASGQPGQQLIVQGQLIVTRLHSRDHQPRHPRRDADAGVRVRWSTVEPKRGPTKRGPKRNEEKVRRSS